MSTPNVNRTQVIARSGYGPWRRADVLASYRIAGRTFLLHRSIGDSNRFVATYAPVGLHAGEYDSIEEAIEYLTYRADTIARSLDSAVKRLEEDHIPLLGPETGIQSFDWKYREQSRFDSKEYLSVPDLGRVYPAEHYLHLSVTKTESDFVAYTPNETYGLADRQVRLKFGKYLKKTFPDMSDAEVQSAVVGLRAKLALAETPATLIFATDRATISRIFETQMYACDSSYTSCMHGKFDGDTVRPYHVYADSPDVAVAYVTERGEIVSRSVVSMKDKTWVRAYSVKQDDATYCQMLADMLKQVGYKRGSLVGNRLTNLGENCVPYIDHGGMGIVDCGEYWEVCEEGDGDYNADHTDGGCSRTRPLCPRCEEEEDHCECSSCDCCEEMYYGTPTCNCSMCPECDRCIEHNGCICARCTECSEIISPNYRFVTTCECDRCEECNKLRDECECEPEEETEETETEVSA